MFEGATGKKLLKIIFETQKYFPYKKMLNKDFMDITR